MNSKTAKILRKFAEHEKLSYTKVKNYFESRDKKTQLIHLSLMKSKIEGGDNKMASIKSCDRCKGIIPEGAPYFQLIAKVDNQDKPIDLDEKCGNDFKAFMENNPYLNPPQATQQQQAQSQPAQEVQQANPNPPTGPEQPQQ